MTTSKRGKAQRVSRLVCANSTVHFLLTYRLSMLVQPSECPLKPVQCAFLPMCTHTLPANLAQGVRGY